MLHKVNLSNSVDVGSRTYDIKFVDDKTFVETLQSYNVADDDLNNIKSFINYDVQLIMVRASLKSDHKRELIFHELLHAFIEDSGIQLDKDVIEQFVSALAPRMTQLFEQINTVM